MWVVPVFAAAACWIALWLVPWRPWSTRERLEAADAAASVRADDVTALVPARDEAALLGTTLAALRAQAADLRIVVVDDQSEDGTADVARAAGATVVGSAPLPPGWTGKLWALEQGLQAATTPWILLVDADIELAPGTLAALRTQAEHTVASLVSLAAQPRLVTFWERLLLPAFVYFFRLLYPFALSNGPSPHVAAAAGGCILIERRVLERIGGFAALRGALIDDCTLARRAKDAGFRTWIGLTHAARSLRPAERFAQIRDMVARTAFTQLRYSVWLLIGCTAAMLLAFAAPVAGLFAPAPGVRAAAALALVASCATYVPLLRYYRLRAARAATLPVVALLFLGMTWVSAARYWRGTRSAWKGRTYGRGNRPALPRVD